MGLRYLAAVVALALVALLAAAATDKAKTHDTFAGSVVKLKAGAGHGSAVHIGGGFLLTAAHVVPANTDKLVAQMDDGTSQDAQVLWANKANDIALLSIAVHSGVAMSTLVCREPKDGEELSAKGNPVNLEFITTRGRVAGKAREVGPWKNAVPVDMAIAGGMSGGGVFDASGRLVGIVTGMMLMPFGFGGTAVGIGYIVPGSTVCGLLARGAA